MELAGLLSFPVEILHNISQYLSVDDVLCCSKACHYLRMAFNDNYIWGRFLPENIQQLDSQDHITAPAFQWEHTLTPLCENRLLYMKANHLLNNWRTANFTKCTSKTLHSYASGVFNVPKGRGQVIYKNTFIFLGRFTNDIESDGIEVWDISKEPTLHSFLEIKNINYKHFYIINSCLVVVECLIVKVYQITIPEKEFPLLYSFVITETDVAKQAEARHEGRCNFDCVGWSTFNVGQYLLCNKCCGEMEDNILHVWDIKNATKVGSFATPMNGFSISLHSSHRDSWFLRENIQSLDHQFYFWFNVKEKSFSETVFKLENHAHHLIFYKSHILAFNNVDKPNSEGWYDTECTVYNYKTSAKVKIRRFNNARRNYQIGSTKIVNGLFIILCFDCFQIIDALTLETVDHFQFDLDVRFITHQYNILGSVFVVASGIDNVLYVWDIKKKQKLPQSLDVVYTSHLYLNDTMTKLVTLDYFKINALHFW